MKTAEASATVPVTAIVTAYQRIEQTIDAVRRIQACQPCPEQVLVHVDGNQLACAKAVRCAFPKLEVIVSIDSVGPGGGRNKLVAAARNEIIASFDDDSYPVDTDYFARVVALNRTFPDAAIYSANVFHRGEKTPEDPMVAAFTASFGSGGAIFKRTMFIAAGGFVPLVVAYGMEEEDLALRLFDQGQRIVASNWLRVFHDTDLSHHASPRINAGAISNLALLAWLRYPPIYWPYGALQIINRVVWCLKVGRRSGVVKGLLDIPRHLAVHRHLRKPVSLSAMKQRFKARRQSLQNSSFSLEGAKETLIE